jgi:20S proteasome alpha/beta subunit
MNTESITLGTTTANKGNQSAHPPIDIHQRPQYPAKRELPLREKAMTIAAGFLCQDGIVICADQQVTHPDGSKTMEKKVWDETYANLSVVITGADDWMYLKATAERLIGVLSACNSITEARHMITDTLRSVFENDIGKDPNITSPPGVKMIIGLATNGELALIKTANLAAPLGNPVEFTGAGEALARNWLDSFYHNPSEIRVCKASEAVILGTYILARVKKSAYGCGGPTNIYWLDSKGEITVPEVEYLEEIFPDLKVPFRRLLLAQANVFLPDNDFEAEFDWAKTCLQTYREDHKKYRKFFTRRYSKRS